MPRRPTPVRRLPFVTQEVAAREVRKVVDRPGTRDELLEQWMQEAQTTNPHLAVHIREYARSVSTRTGINMNDLLFGSLLMLQMLQEQHKLDEKQMSKV